MDNISENLGLYDFFNVIGAGAIFNIHIMLLFPDVLSKYQSMITNEMLQIIGFVILSFFFGLVIQEVSEVIKRPLRIKEKMEKRFLIDKDIIGNDIKLKMHRRYAKDILHKKQIKHEKKLNEKQNEYIYAYVIYYIEHRKRNKKLERMRALYGMSKLLICTMFLIFLAAATGIFISMDLERIKICIGICIYSAVTAVLFYKRANRVMKFQIRMAMGVYESCIDDNYIENNRKDDQK